MPEGRLLTVACTTGWLDWIHSELWLFEEGLFVARTGLIRTILNSRAPEITSPAPFGHLEPNELRALQRSHRWISSTGLLTARFNWGVLTRGVDLISVGGTQKLLWPSTHRVEPPLREACRRWGLYVQD
jgi:hypothetical protein